ncbi:MAG: bifunctional diaminohydroxyphosphoribosylaminopyrimidine deaminase/5-amino-6-(5-phosphoribosylamino)uracil reductase RibD [Flavobacteriales bacterium]
MTWSSQDVRWMTRALELASRGRFTTWPNPMVGCVVVQDDRLLAEGWHRQHGKGHAEVNALAQLAPSVDLSRATAYVTLEPCSHTGKTPPCADLLVSRGVGRVVVAMKDPNPLVAGRGLERLQHAGATCEVGCLEGEARRLNAAFVHIITKQSPWVTLKWAQSSDGYMDGRTSPAIGAGGWPITGAASRRWTHVLRARHDALLVGMRTWLVDTPSLTTRDAPGPSPRPLVLTRGQTPRPESAKASSNWKAAPVLVHPDSGASEQALDTWRQAGYETLALSSRAMTTAWWSDLRQELDCAAVLVEGGARVAELALATSSWHELHVLQSPKSLGTGLSAPSLPKSSPSQRQACGEDDVQIWENPAT